MFNIRILIVSFFLTILLSCATQNRALSLNEKANDLLVVDCLLPGQVRQLGQIASYIAARRAIKTTAVDCEIRGGEYVAYDRANYLTALNIWLPKAQQGDPQAQNYVGEIYEKGLGIKPDYEMAFVWYKKAAKQGYAKAQTNLGSLYERGLGVEKNNQKAIQWYAKSSHLSSSDIPFATTLTTHSTKNPLSAELSLLKTALHNSRLESKRLQDKLAMMATNLSTGKVKLASLQQALDRVQEKINSTPHLSPQEQFALKQSLNTKTEAVLQQQQRIKALEHQYQEKITALTASLASTQKRAEQISRELKQKSDQANQSQLALLTAEAKLAKTEQKLIQANQLSQQRLSQLNKLAADNALLRQTEQKLKQTQQAILQQQQQQTLSQQEIDRLNSQKQQIERVKQALKKQMSINNLSAEKVANLRRRLQQQQQLARQNHQALQQVQTQLEQTEATKNRLLAESRQQLQRIKQEKAKLLAKISQDQQIQGDYQAQINHQTQQLEQLKAQLAKEKKRYQADIKKWQQQAKVEQGSQPQIEIIDPPFTLTRGIPTVTLRSVVMQREIVGKVNTPNGLLSLVVNDKKSQVNKQGLFKTNIRIIANQTPVKVVAVDQQGAKAQLNFVLSVDKAKKRMKALENNPVVIQTQAKKSWQGLNFGQYHALIIGNNNYQKIPKLDTPEADAREIERILRQYYGFKTQLLLNGNRYQILSALNKLRANLTAKDNLLIYYAGHGELDQVNMRGHWLPVDADADNTANWISTVAITDILNAMAVKHILVVSDSCYSGAMTRSSLARLDTGMTDYQRVDWLKAMLKAQSRTVLTSGGLKPVLDGGGGEHSVFAKAFIQALKNNHQLLEGQALYRDVSAGIVATASRYGIEQVPEYGPIRYAGHESGEFFFVPKL